MGARRVVTIVDTGSACQYRKPTKSVLTPAVGRWYGSAMTDARLVTTPWHQRAEELGVSLEYIAVFTKCSFATVYAYKVGRRRTPPAWLARVEALLADRALLSGLTEQVS